MHRNGKPVRKCHGCGLNFRDHCGVYDNPHEQWSHHRRCPGYMNEKMLADYEANRAGLQGDPKREKRKAVAKKRKTESHHDGDQHVLITVRP